MRKRQCCRCVQGECRGTPSLTLAETLQHWRQGRRQHERGNSAVQDDLGAVANYGSNTVSQLVRYDNSIAIGKTIPLAPDCVKPDSVALTQEHLFVVGANCAESHAWPWGFVDGPVVSLSDPSAAQIAVGKSWAAVTMSSGSLLQLPLTGNDGVLNGTSNAIHAAQRRGYGSAGAAFWGNILGFTPAHSPDSFAIVDEDGTLIPSPDQHHPIPSMLPAGWPKGRGTSGTRATPRRRDLRSSSATTRAGCSTNRCPCRARRPTSLYLPDRKWLAVIYTSAAMLMSPFSPSTDTGI
jgi:hypothetical protein